MRIRDCNGMHRHFVTNSSLCGDAEHVCWVYQSAVRRRTSRVMTLTGRDICSCHATMLSTQIYTSFQVALHLLVVDVNLFCYKYDTTYMTLLQFLSV